MNDTERSGPGKPGLWNALAALAVLSAIVLGAVFAVVAILKWAF